MKSKYNRLSRLNQIVLAVATTGALMSSAHATAYKWTSVALANSNWSVTGNWDTNGVPVNDGTADVTFTDFANNGYQMKVDPQNSLPTPSNNWSINSLTFANDAVGTGVRTIAGVNSNATLSIGAGGINQNENNSPNFQVPVICTASQTWYLNNWNGNNTGGMTFGGDGWGGTTAGTGNITLNNGVMVTKTGNPVAQTGTPGVAARDLFFYAGTTTTVGTGAFTLDGGSIYFEGSGQFGRLGSNALTVTSNTLFRTALGFQSATGGTYSQNVNIVGQLNGSNTALTIAHGNGVTSAGETTYLTGQWSGTIYGGGTNATGFISPSTIGARSYDDRYKLVIQGDNSGLNSTGTYANGRFPFHVSLGVDILDGANALGTGNILMFRIGNNSNNILNTYCGLLATNGNTVGSEVYVNWVQNGSGYRNPVVELGLSGTGSVNYTGNMHIDSVSANGYVTGTGNGWHQLQYVKLTAPSSGTVNFSGIISDSAVQTSYSPVTIHAGGTVQLSNNNTYHGTTAVRGGTLLLGNNNAMGTSTGATNVSLGDTVTAPASGSVVAATTSEFNTSGMPSVNVSSFTYDNITNFGTITFSGAVSSIDGVTLSAGNRVLYKDSTNNPERSGVYTVTDSTHWTRASDMNTPANFPSGLSVNVLYGTLNGGTSYYLPTGLYSTAVLNTTTADSGNVFANAMFYFNRDVAPNSNVAILTNGAYTISRNINVTNNLSTGQSILGGNTAASSTFSGTVTLAKNLAVQAATSGTVTFSGDITGGYGVTAQGSGLVKFSTAKSYTGATSVSSGTLEVDNTIASSGVSVGSGGTLQGTGTVTNTLSVTGTGVVSPGLVAVGALHAGNTTISGHLAANVDDLSANELISTGTINLAGGTIDVTVGGGGFTQPYYVIAAASSITGTPSVTTGYTLTNTGTELRLSLTPTTHSISGTVTRSGSALSGVTVSDGTRTATTDGSGAYTITSVPDSATYTVTPSLTGYTFSPANQSVTLSGSDVTGINFAVANAYGNWATIHGLSGADAATTANPSHDGLSNLVKYALDLNPAVSAQPAGTLSGSTLSFTKGAMAKADSNLVYSIEESTDLTTWTAPTGSSPSGSVSNLTNTITYTFPSGQTKVFARLKVVQNP